ncbi:class I SAM-dependent methyltransferase [Pseudomonas sp. RIT-PI-S]|uniref:class I SAM-dependent methyltransferase n=1 Tax=Pseudomonas sp. RIT-PI-S TaxID=3035295 RepID=UPI0021D81EA1|nr:class I SAM-dependent methyltransferase [Pseudomonas sp. RIT-PI-S]
MDASALAFVQQCLDEALAAPPNEARRLLHGRGRRWPGLEQLTIDWLEGVLQVTLFKPLGDEAYGQLLALLNGLVASPQWASSGAEGLLVQQRYLEGSPALWLFGEPSGPRRIHEAGLAYWIEPGRAQNSGFFLDMREGRRWVREHAEGKRVLNLFAYTCAFSVAAIAGGAQAVVNLDMASPALARGRENHRANGHDLSRVSFLPHDLFKSWGKVSRQGPYDLIIVDPPSFQRGSFILSRDYPKVLRKLEGLLSADGQVLACLNDPALPADFLRDAMATQAPGLQFVERLANPGEFADSEAEAGLKVLLFRR